MNFGGGCFLRIRVLNINMVVIGLRVFYIGLPIALIIWYCMAPNQFTQTLQYCQSIQGTTGWVRINPAESKSYGSRMTDWLMAEFGENANEGWKGFFRQSGMDLDRVIHQVEDYWLWGSLSILFVGGLGILFCFRDYK